MHRPPNKKAVRYRLAVLYTVTPILILLVSAFLVLYSIGYRFNLSDQQVSQGGLLQLRSSPSGAVVTVDNKRVDGRTPNRADLAAGLHTVMMKRDGYLPWQKTITIEPGKILWLNYARLIPEDIKISELANYPLTSSTLAAPNGRLVAMIADSSKPELNLIKVDGAKVSENNIAIPRSLYQPGSKDKFSLMSWSDDSRYLLLRHQNLKKSEVIFIDTTDASRITNLTSIAGRPIDEVDFIAKTPKQLYVIVDSNIRIIDTETKTVSAPLINQVSEFSQSPEGLLVYATHRDAKSNQRTVGFYTKNSEKPYPVRTYYDDGTKPLRVEIGEYLRNRYLAIQYGTIVEINQLPVVDSNSNVTLALTSLATIAVPNDTHNVSFSPSNRFILIKHRGGFISYDLELGALANTTLKSDLKQNYQLEWLDKYMLWTNQNGVLTTYEYDGSNVHELASNTAPSQAVLLSADEKNIYAFQQANDHLALIQISLTTK